MDWIQGVLTMVRFAVVFCALIITSVGYADDKLFQKKAIQMLAKHFSIPKDPSNLKDRVDEDALNYLDLAIQIYEKGKLSDAGGLPPSALEMASIALSFKGLSLYDRMSTIRMGGMTFETFSNGDISINGVRQKAHIKTVAELETALQKDHTFTIKTCVEDIGVAAEKALIASQEREKVQQAQYYATSEFVPSGLRTHLLGAFAEFDIPELEDWLLQQGEFKDSTRDKLVQKLVKKALANGKDESAEKLIRGYLTSGYAAQESASKDVFNYHLHRSDIPNAERILSSHFTKGYSAYENLAEVLFNYYMNLNDLGSAEGILRKHYTKGYSASDKIAERLINCLVQRHNYEEARNVADRNMSQGYSEHDKAVKKILEAEVAYLRALKR
jgi:hypothetical protein